MYISIDRATNKESLSPIPEEISIGALFRRYHSQYAPVTIDPSDEIIFQKLVEHPRVFFLHANTSVGSMNAHRIANYTTDIPLETILHNIEEIEFDIVVNELWGIHTGLFKVGVAMVEKSPVLDAAIRKALIDGFLSENP